MWPRWWQLLILHSKLWWHLRLCSQFCFTVKDQDTGKPEWPEASPRKHDVRSRKGKEQALPLDWTLHSEFSLLYRRQVSMRCLLITDRLRDYREKQSRSSLGSPQSGFVWSQLRLLILLLVGVLGMGCEIFWQEIRKRTRGVVRVWRKDRGWGRSTYKDLPSYKSKLHMKMQQWNVLLCMLINK